MVRINGELVQAAGSTIGAFLAEHGYQMDRVVVERNLEILSKDEFDKVIMQDGDNIEILCFVGGG